MSSNIIALDVGERRVGVAIASLEAKLARPLLTLDTQHEVDLYATIIGLASENEATTIVVGLPRNLDQRDTAQTKLVREFAKNLQDRVPGVKIELQDEAGTSIKATEELIAKNPAFTKSDVDKLAACYILEDWLEQNL